MARPLVWDIDGRDWPHRDSSFFVEAAGLCWHVQRFDAPAAGAPLALLLHGTGASTHSWRGLVPLLREQGLAVLAMDLPGHAFTGLPPGGTRSTQLSLPGMADAVGVLLRKLEARPALVIGHSAGAALAVQMVLDGMIAPSVLAGINAALVPLRGLPRHVFSPLAKLMAATPVVPMLFSWRAADPAVLGRLIDSTGSRLDARGLDLYARLVQNPDHAAGALGMMAQWDLPALAKRLPALRTPLHLLAASGDRTVPPHDARRAAALLATEARRPVLELHGLGHLAHEENPSLVAQALAGPLLDELSAARRGG